ncbi:MAG TPA: hypothetical protein VL979_04425 [Solirubrobacteraceae bacterium]|nr:hypothetical protein [Solirubrobacteraceae bacterium]
MRTIFARALRRRRQPAGRWRSGLGTGLTGPLVARARLLARAGREAPEAGLMLMEVLVSALIIGLVVVATLTGLDALTHSGTEERARNEAAVLAAESQQNLRSEPANLLLSLENNANVYTISRANTKYTVTQEASYDNGEQISCASSETKKGQGSYILVSTKITWPHMKVHPVVESSIITPPTGSGIDVEASNGEIATAGVPVVIKYTPNGSKEETKLEGSTGTAGCVLFAGIPATEATVEIAPAPGIVSPAGNQTWPIQKLTLAPNVITHVAIRAATAGAITARFTFKGQASYEHINNQGKKEPQNVEGDTFVAYNAEMGESPNFQKGNALSPTTFSSTAGKFEVAPAGFKATITSPTQAAKYPAGNLFPFPSPKAWTAYAGDCPENNPEKWLATEKAETAVLLPGEDKTLNVPLTYVELNVYSRSQKLIKEKLTKKESVTSYLETSTSYEVTISNTKCSAQTPNNTVTNATAYKHVQLTTTGSENGGHLQDPFQPFGEFKICLKKTATKAFEVKSAYVNKEPEKPVVANIYLNLTSESEVASSEREDKEVSSC